MPAKDPDTLKSFFKTDSIPSQDNFADLIDSAFNKTAPLAVNAPVTITPAPQLVQNGFLLRVQDPNANDKFTVDSMGRVTCPGGPVLSGGIMVGAPFKFQIDEQGVVTCPGTVHAGGLQVGNPTAPQPIDAGNIAAVGDITARSFAGAGSGLTGLRAENIQGVLNPATVKLDASGITGRLDPSQLPVPASAPTPAQAPAPLNLRRLALLKWTPNTVTSFPTGKGPFGLCFDGASIWVANSGDDNVTRIDACTGALIGTYPAGKAPACICFDGAFIWVGNASGNSNVTKLSAATGALIGTYPSGNNPECICFDGTSIWTSNCGDSRDANGNLAGTVTKIDPHTGATLATGFVERRPWGLCFDGTRLWVVHQNGNTVSTVDPATAAVNGGPYTVGRNPFAVCFDGSHVWCANQGDNTVSKLDAGTGAVLATLPAGKGPSDVCFDGSHVWVANSGEGTVMKLDPAAGTILGTYPAGNGRLCFDGANIWATKGSNNTVNKL